MNAASDRVYKTTPEQRERTRAYAAANPERVSAYQRTYYETHGEEKRAYARAYSKTKKARRAAAERRRRDRLGPRYMKNYNLVAKYGIDLVTYDRMVADRGGLCDICKRKPDGKRHHGVLHIDHDHTANGAKGPPRGLLCGRCNTAIGLFLEDTSLMLAAVGYLERHGRAEVTAEDQDRNAGPEGRGGSAQWNANIPIA